MVDLKVITEAVLRDELRASNPDSYLVPHDKLLSPAAKEYLQQLKIKVVYEKRPSKSDNNDFTKYDTGNESDSASEETPAAFAKPKYVDYVTGAYYIEKPEHMTQLYGNKLVPKEHKRIAFRGKLDSLEALFVLNQTIICEINPKANELIEDLEDVLNVLREMMRADVLNEPFKRNHMIGLTHSELRERSHNPMKYYKIKQMVLPSYRLGRTYAMLNQMRAAVREVEVYAVTAFHVGNSYEREDIIEELNRMSSAMHIITCKYLASGDVDLGAIK